MNKKQILIFGLIIISILVIVIFAGLLFANERNVPTASPVTTSTQIANNASSTTSSTPTGITPTNSYAINLPDSLILVDSQGRRTGEDPITSVTYHEISGTSYFEEGDSGQLYFTAPPTGQYILYVLGGATGPYNLDYWIDNGGSNPPKRETVSGNIQKGSMVAYVQDYDAANTASSTFSISSTVSSTASITSAPPNNLPPPPVP
jgi:hypothetical protein